MWATINKSNSITYMRVLKIAKMGMQSTDEIPGYSMIILHITGYETNVYIVLCLILFIRGRYD